MSVCAGDRVFCCLDRDVCRDQSRIFLITCFLHPPLRPSTIPPYVRNHSMYDLLLLPKRYSITVSLNACRHPKCYRTHQRHLPRRPPDGRLSLNSLIRFAQSVHLSNGNYPTSRRPNAILPLVTSAELAGSETGRRKLRRTKPDVRRRQQNGLPMLPGPAV